VTPENTCCARRAATVTRAQQMGRNFHAVLDATESITAVRRNSRSHTSCPDAVAVTSMRAIDMMRWHGLMAGIYGWVVRSCQRAHHEEHKADCINFSRNFLHCSICDSTINTRTCQVCYKTAVCDRDKCVSEHSKTQKCEKPQDVLEKIVMVYTEKGGDGTLSIVDPTRGGLIAPTWKNLINLMLCMNTIHVYTDRSCLVYFQLGNADLGVSSDWTGPIWGVSLDHLGKFTVCTDGMYRTPISKLRITAGAGGPHFDVEGPINFKVGMNSIKVGMVVIPLSCTTPPKNAGSSG
jgi:hypothetical protein